MSEKKEDYQLRQDIEEINKGGWEEDAALIVGKKEEAGRLRSRLETEGQAVDLATYMRLHKQIIIPKEEAKELVLFSKVKAVFGGEISKGDYVAVKENNNLTIYFFDKDLNLAKVYLNLGKDSDLTEIRQALEGQPNTPRDSFIAGAGAVFRNLSKLGFVTKGSNYDGQKDAGADWIEGLIDEYNDGLKRKIASQKLAEFDF